MNRRRAIIIGLIVFIVFGISVALHRASMRTITTPQKIVYNGHLLSSTGAVITTPHTVRFSFWSSGDYLTTDTTGTGAINWESENYVGWFEEFTVTPNVQGYFSVELGSGKTIPDFAQLSRETLLSLFIQVEVKVATAPDTAYEMLDIDSSDETLDRSPMLSVPFALNADYIDQREIGTSSGDIAILQEGDVFSPTHIPQGTDQDIFVIDFDDSVDPSTGTLVLQFGNPGQTLAYRNSGSVFSFSDDLIVQGDIVASGGLQLGDYNPGTNTGAGVIRWNGTDFEGYDGTEWRSLTAGGLFIGTTSSTSSGSFASGGLIGYQAANLICNAEFPGAHMCQIDEVITTINRDLTAFSGSVNAWVAEGAPGYTSDSNDCTGWTSGSGAHLGAWWEFSEDAGVSVRNGGGVGYLTNCAVKQPISCCS